MSAPRTYRLALAALAAAGLAVPQAGAQVAGQVGQAVAPQLMQAGSIRGTQGPVALPTLEEDRRGAEQRRRRQEAERGAANAGAASVTGRVRYPTQKQVRAMRGLTRPPNRAVLPPTRAQTPEGLAGPSVVIAPGLNEPVPKRRKRPEAEKDPFAPTGIMVGGLRVLPAIEMSAGYDTNALRRTSGATNIKGSPLYQITPEFSVQSDWSRHALQLDLRGTYSYYQHVKDADRPTLDGKLSLRGDVRETTTITAEFKERIDSQRPGSADLSSAVKGRPLTYVHSASLAWAEKFGKSTVTGTALVDRAEFEDATTYAGTRLSQKDREYTSYGAKLRGAYEISPGLSPFVEVSADKRDYDLKYDTATYRRSSKGAIGKIGAAFEFSRMLTGEASAGWGIRTYDDTRLSDLSGLVADASLIWQMTPLTKVTGKIGTEFIETTQAGSPGALGHKASVEVAHDLLRNLTLTGTAAFTNAEYKGINREEDTYTLGARADYKINRNLVVRGSYAYERSLSNQTASSYLSHVFLMGIRLQQ